MKKNNLVAIFLTLLLTFFVSMAIAQDNDAQNIKRKAYDELSQTLQDLEEKAQYHGDDSVIRNRLNLPPKLGSFEEWLAQQENALRKKEALELAAQKKLQENSQNQKETQLTPVEDKTQEDAKPKNAVPHYPYTQIETYLISAIYFVLLSFNFIIYSRFPKLRKVSIAPPFDIGVSGQKSDAENSTKTVRYLIELTLLIIVLVLLTGSISSGRIFEDENISRSITEALSFFSVSYIGYVLIRFIAGLTSKCPKCNTPFAAKSTNSYTEPRVTFQKGKVNPVTVESGIKVSEYICRNCSHTWKKTQNYTKTVSF